MSKKEIYILGVGHNTPVYIELCEACGYHILGLYHYNHDLDGTEMHGYPILGCFEDLLDRNEVANKNFALSQGNNDVRASVFLRIIEKGGNVPSLIHPSAEVSRFATLGTGTVIHMKSIVHPDVIIGDNTVLSYNVSLTHNVIVGNHCYFAAGCIIGAYVNIHNYAFCGIGTIAVSAKVDNIGEHAYVGASSLLTKDVDAFSVVAGIPAKKIRDIEH